MNQFNLSKQDTTIELPKKQLRALLVSALVFVAAGFMAFAEAAPIEIESTPQQTTGKFLHNVLHTASGESAGQIKAWVDLDKGQFSSYDPETGELHAFMALYSNPELTNRIGDAELLGDMKAANFEKGAHELEGNPPASIAGTVNWILNAYDNTDFANYLNVNYGDFENVNVAMGYLNRHYVTSDQGRTANSWKDGELTLWGADNYTENGFDNPELGSDLVLRIKDAETFTSSNPAAVAVPAGDSLILLLLALPIVLRRRS